MFITFDMRFKTMSCSHVLAEYCCKIPLIFLFCSYIMVGYICVFVCLVFFVLLITYMSRSENVKCSYYYHLKSFQILAMYYCILLNFLSSVYFMVSSAFFTRNSVVMHFNDESMYQCSNQVMLARMQSKLLQAEFSIFQLHANTIINAYVKVFCKIFYLML